MPLDFENLEFQQDTMGLIYLCSTLSGVLVEKTESLGVTKAEGCAITTMSGSRCWILAELIHVESSWRLGVLIARWLGFRVSIPRDTGQKVQFLKA